VLIPGANPFSSRPFGRGWVSWADGALSHSFGTRDVTPGLITLPR
jgi:hypothetical protein